MKANRDHKILPRLMPSMYLPKSLITMLNRQPLSKAAASLRLAKAPLRHNLSATFLTKLNATQYCTSRSVPYQQKSLQK